MKTVILSGLVTLLIAACGKVDAHPKPGSCTICDLDLSAVTERAGMLCNADELLRGTKVDVAKGPIAVCVKPVCKCCN